MTAQELHDRIEIWKGAARTMGVEADEHRIAGLVEVTKIVPMEFLREAVVAVMRTEVGGFMPSPGAVISAYRAASEHRSRKREIAGPVEMTREQHERWMAVHNPQGWSDRTWKAYVERLSIDSLFRTKAEDALRRRHEWVDEQMLAEIGKRKVDAGYRIRLRRQIVSEAEYHIGRPDPLEDGWLPSAEFDPIAGLARKATA